MHDILRDEKKRMSFIEITSEEELRQQVESGSPLVVHFWADWCRACGPLNSEILPELQRQHPSLRLLKVGHSLPLPPLTRHSRIYIRTGGG